MAIQHVLYHRKKKLICCLFWTNPWCLLHASYSSYPPRVRPAWSHTQATRIKTHFPCAAPWFFHVQNTQRFLQASKEAAARMQNFLPFSQPRDKGLCRKMLGGSGHISLSSCSGVPLGLLLSCLMTTRSVDQPGSSRSSQGL